jgi:hypothetical protein
MDDVYSTNLKRLAERLLSALLPIPAAESEDLSKIIDFRAVGIFHKAVIGEVDPGFAIQDAELL